MFTSIDNMQGYFVVLGSCTHVLLLEVNLSTANLLYSGCDFSSSLRRMSCCLLLKALLASSPPVMGGSTGGVGFTATVSGSGFEGTARAKNTSASGLGIVPLAVTGLDLISVADVTRCDFLLCTCSAAVGECGCSNSLLLSCCRTLYLCISVVRYAMVCPLLSNSSFNASTCLSRCSSFSWYRLSFFFICFFMSDTASSFLLRSSVKRQFFASYSFKRLSNSSTLACAPVRRLQASEACSV